MWPAKIQISLRILAVWSESLLIACAFYSLDAIQAEKTRPLLYWVNIQADLNLCWSHRSYCRFCRALAHLYAATWEKNKQTSDMYFQQRLKSACTSLPSDRSLCTLGYPKCAQWRFWSDCTTVLIILVLKFNPSPAEPDMSCLCKKCRSKSVGFWRSQLIGIYTICH